MKVFTLKLSKLGGTNVSRRTCFPVEEELWILRLGETESCKMPCSVRLSLLKVKCWALNPKCNVLGTSHLYWIPSLQNYKTIHFCALSIAQLFPCYSSTKQIKKARQALLNHLLREAKSSLRACPKPYMFSSFGWQGRSVLCFLTEVRSGQHSTCPGSHGREIRCVTYLGSWSESQQSLCDLRQYSWSIRAHCCHCELDIKVRTRERGLRFSSDKVGLIPARIPEPNRTIKWRESSMANDDHGANSELHLYAILPHFPP